MPSPLHVAIFGCGSMGEIHARCLSQIEGVRLRALCDADETRARALASSFPADYTTTDPERVFRDDAVDAVYVCTYHDTHSTLAIRAAEARKHVMMEKPLALTLRECYEVGEAVEKHGITLMTGFKMRYYPSVARAREFIPSPIVTIAQMMDARWPDDFWANDPVKGGGNVLSQGCHTMDLVCHLSGSEPVRHLRGGRKLHSPPARYRRQHRGDDQVRQREPGQRRPGGLRTDAVRIEVLVPAHRRAQNRASPGPPEDGHTVRRRELLRACRP